MRLVLAASRAKLLEFQTIRGRLFILHIAVVSFLALGALERNDFARHVFILLP